MNTPHTFDAGAPRAVRWMIGVGVVGGAVGLGALTAQSGLAVPVGVIAACGAAFIAGFLLKRPRWAVGAAFAMAFLGLGLKRYVNAPWGLTIDLLLIIAWIGVLASDRVRITREAFLNPPALAALIWMAYVGIQIVNPEARSLMAWAYAMRGVGLYFVLTVPLVYILFARRTDLDRFVHAWFALAVLGTLHGLRQKLIGVDPFEQAWLDAGAAVQHVLFGRLRVFSFFSDAGQFGAMQGHVAVTAGVMMLSAGLSWKRRSFYALTTVCGLVGLFISGTRGAMAVPFLGGITYLVLSKNWRMLLLGVVAMAGAYGFLRYTTIANGVYEINRMRAAIVRGADTPSMQVRLENQRRLAAYMDARPVVAVFGGGIGSVGSWGRRFSPGTFLAEFPPDSWYVRIWAEMGGVGLALHLGLLVFLMGYAAVLLWRVHDPPLRSTLIGLHAGIMGILLASYGNQVLGQMPTALIVYISFAYLFLGPTFAPDAADA